MQAHALWNETAQGSRQSQRETIIAAHANTRFITGTDFAATGLGLGVLALINPNVILVARHSSFPFWASPETVNRLV